MKRCPECGREYDNTMMFCLDDGAALLYGPARSEPGAAVEGPTSMPEPTGFPPDEPATAILHSTAAPDEAPTRAQVHMTDQPDALPTGRSDIENAKGIDKRLIFAPLVLTVIILGGFFGYRYITPAKQIESIAVLPFVNDSGNADVEYLSDGMTETLINSLSQLPNLSVKARSSVFRYKGKDIDPKKVASELGVQAILTGRVKQRGDQLTLNVELIDAQSENTIWGNKYERKGSDLVALQSEIARDVSGRLKSKLTGADVAKLEKSYTKNPEAYQLYLKGRYLWNKRTGDSLKQAAEYYKKAIENDPNYARAYAGLAETSALYGLYAVAPPHESMPKAKIMALRALEIDESLSDAHAALGFYFSEYEYDWASAEREFRRAIELDPNYATAYHWLGNSVLGATKRSDEALTALRRAEEIDPLSPIIGSNLADNLLYKRRYDDAIAKYKSVLLDDPNFAYGRFGLGLSYYAKGAYAEAIGEYRRSLEISYDPQTDGYLAATLAKAGQHEEAEGILRKLKEDYTKEYVPNVAIVFASTGLGRREEALDWLEKAVAAREPYLTWLAVDPIYDDLRSEPRFKAMLKQLNLPE